MMLFVKILKHRIKIAVPEGPSELEVAVIGSTMPGPVVFRYPPILFGGVTVYDCYMALH